MNINRISIHVERTIRWCFECWRASCSEYDYRLVCVRLPHTHTPTPANTHQIYVDAQIMTCVGCYGLFAHNISWVPSLSRSTRWCLGLVPCILCSTRLDCVMRVCGWKGGGTCGILCCIEFRHPYVMVDILFLFYLTIFARLREIYARHCIGKYKYRFRKTWYRNLSSRNYIIKRTLPYGHQSYVRDWIYILAH